MSFFSVAAAIICFMLYRSRPKSPPARRWQKLSGSMNRGAAVAHLELEEVIVMDMDEPTCDNCGRDCEITTANSVFVYIEQEPFYSFVLFTCQCGDKSRIFYKVSEHAEIVEFGLGVVHFPFAPEGIKEQWLNLYADEPEYVDECFGVGQTDELPTTDEILDEVLVVDFNRWLAGISPDDFAGGGES